MQTVVFAPTPFLPAARRRRAAGAQATLRRLLVLAVFCAFAGLLAAPVRADCRDGRPFPAARVILGLYDSREEPQPRDTRLHRFLELPLNHSGYVIEYWDVAAGLPPAVLRSDVVAVASWFRSPLADTAGYEAWAAAVSGECTPPRWLVMDDPGTAEYGVDTPERAAFMARLGLSAPGSEILIGSFAERIAADAELPAFESAFVIEPDSYRPLRAQPGATSYLRIAPSPETRDQAIDLFVAGPEGIYLHGSAAITYDRRTGDTFWIVDPFRLIAMLLGEDTLPIPDVTTLDGRRIFFSTVMAEGWLSAEPALNFGQDLRIAAEILRDRMIVPYGDLPQTVAVLTGDFEPGRDERAAIAGRSVAEQIFALPQVLIGSSGNSMVRNWQFFARYDRDSETRQIDAFAPPAPKDEISGLVNIAVRNLKGAFASPRSGSDLVPNAPRKYTETPFDLGAEITGALATVDALAPPARSPSAFVWSGDARPFREALALVREAGIPAIGGGGGIYNTFSPSLSNLSSFYASVGSEMQVYDGLSGDSAYTGYWTAPRHGFHQLGATLDATEAPRRLKPFHLAYNAQSMIGMGTRSAVAAALDRARSDPVIPITAAEYAGIVAGFRSFRAEPAGADAWRIRDRGALQTLRFDRAADLALDLGRSTGVLGATRANGSLYVALLPDDPAPLVVLARQSGGAMRRDAATFGLRESRFQITGMTAAACGVTLAATGWGAGRMIWETRPAADFVLTVTDPALAVVLQEVTVTSDSDGLLDLALPPLQGQPVTIALTGEC